MEGTGTGAAEGDAGGEFAEDDGQVPRIGRSQQWTEDADEHDEGQRREVHDRQCRALRSAWTWRWDLRPWKTKRQVAGVGV
jgi:hypothetical protein